MSSRAPAATDSLAPGRASSSQDLRRRERADVGVFVHADRRPEPLHARHEAPLELVVRRARATMKRLAAMQDWPLLIVRALTAVSTRGVQIGARHDDERIAAAQLEHRLLEVLAGLRRDLAARALRCR